MLLVDIDNIWVVKTTMSLFDKLPLDITEIIYKCSQKEHIEKLPSNFVKFHLKLAERRLTYRLVRFRKLPRFETEMLRLLRLCESKTDTWQGIQDKIFFAHNICKLILHNKRFLLTQNGYQRIVDTAPEELRNSNLLKDINPFFEIWRDDMTWHENFTSVFKHENIHSISCRELYRKIRTL